MPPKKGRRARRGDDDDEDLLPQASGSTDATEATAGSAAPAPKKTSKKKQAKKKGKALGDWSDEDVADPLAATGSAEEPGVEANGNAADEADEPPARAAPRTKQKKGKAAAKSFAALSMDDGDEDPEALAEAEAEELAAPMAGKRGKQPAGGFAALSLGDADPEEEAEAALAESPSVAAGLSRHDGGFAELGSGDDAASSAKAEPQAAGAPDPDTSGSRERTAASHAGLVVAEVVSVERHPKADRLRVCTVDTGSERLQVVTNASTVRQGLRVAFAGVGVRTPGSGVAVERASLRGVDSLGMLCSAFDLGWLPEPDGFLLELPASAVLGSAVTADPMEGAIYGTDVAHEANGAADGKKKKKKGKKDIGFADLPDPGEADATKPADPPKKEKQKKRGSEKLAAAFAALDLEAEEPAATPAAPEANGVEHTDPEQPAVAVAGGDADSSGAAEGPELLLLGKKKKGRSRTFDPDAAVLAASTDDTAAVTAPEDNAAGGELLLGKKKKGRKKGGFDIDAVLAEVTAAGGQAQGPSAAEPAAAAAPLPAAAAEAPSQPEAKAGKKKAGADDGEDLDALLAEFGVDTEAAAAAESKKSKKKKKGKAAAPEDPDAAAAPSAAPISAPASAAAAPEAATAQEEAGADPSGAAGQPAEEEAEEDEGGGDAEGDAADGKELSAAQKKKLKKKAKEKAKKAGRDGDEEGAAPAKKGPAKKESAAVRKLREEMERQKAAQEAARLAEEERIRQEEEEAQRLEEEARQREEDKARRKEEKARQRAELKRQGLLKTGKEKVEADRLAAMREQILKNAEIDLPAAGETQQKKKVVYGRKRTAPKKDAAEGDAGPDEEDTRAAAAAAAAAAEAEEARQRQEEEAQARARAEAEAAAAAAAATAEAAVEAEDSDSVGWDELDEDQIQLPAQSTAAEAGTGAEEALPNGRGGAQHSAPEAKKPRLDDASSTAAGALEAEPAADISGSASSEGEGDESGSSETESASDEEGEETSSEEDDDSDGSETDSLDSEEAREERLRAARAARAEKISAARQAGSREDLRSPICCILGHVDTGKTKLLDNIRRTSVQEGEAGGITQQIGATYVPGDAISKRTEPVRQGRDFGLKLPGLLIIDTPGHESFTNLRSRGSSLCDIAILVVDIMHGLEPQTIESINLLKQKKTPFIVALNKVDRLFEWRAEPNAAIQASLGHQQPHVAAEFEKNLQRAVLNLNEQGLNVALYWKNPDPRKYVNIVPTSAISGEGIPDMLQLLVQLTQKMMAERLMFISELQCTVLEVKVIEGLGTTIDVVLVNGVLREGDQIVLCGLGGPIATTIRSLLTPHPLKELRVRGSYLHHKEIRAAQGIKIAAQNLESAVAGTQMLVVQKGDRLEDLKEEVMGDMVDIFKSVDKSGEGVCVQASTLGSLEALLEFLRSDAVRIPVSGINIGPVHKRDVMRASTMLEKGRRKFAVILAFDVPVTREAQEQATAAGVRIFTADIIYHLFDQFSAYLKQTKEEEQRAAAQDAVFPVILQILQNCIFNAKDPIVLGCTIEEGIAKVGTPLCVPSRGGFLLGRISSMELNHKPVERARKGDSIAMKIEATSSDESARLYGRHFDFNDRLVSRISRRSIDLLKQHFKDDLERDDWRLVVKLKKTFGID